VIELVSVNLTLFSAAWTVEDRAIIRSKSRALTMVAHDMTDAINIRANVAMGSFAGRLVSAGKKVKG
jgi:hypothetical protein